MGDELKSLPLSSTLTRNQYARLRGTKQTKEKPKPIAQNNKNPRGQYGSARDDK